MLCLGISSIARVSPCRAVVATYLHHLDPWCWLVLDHFHKTFRSRRCSRQQATRANPLHLFCDFPGLLSLGPTADLHPQTRPPTCLYDRSAALGKMEHHIDAYHMAFGVADICS